MKSETNWGSKTVWGFGLALLIGAGQALGIAADPGLTHQIANALQMIFSILGVAGFRSAIREE